MSELVFNKLVEQIDMLTYVQRVKLLKKIVSSFEESKMKNFEKKEFSTEAFGIWKDYDISVEEIRKNAWR